ncbi:MAG: hypothetical protein E6R13_05395 [Spirochaetes bacterium]|nr:MAG: hypothetical protein E6R13_05395 [Spirochaetota bacterium]
MKSLNIAILDIHPDTLKVSYLLKKMLSSEYLINWYVLDFIADGISPNPISGNYFIGQNVSRFQSVSDIVSALYSSENLSLCISETRNKNISLSYFVLGEVLDSIETGASNIPLRYMLSTEKVSSFVSTLIEEFDKPLILKNDASQKPAYVSRISSIKEKPSRKVVVVCSEGYTASSSGTGMFQLLERLCISIAKFCANAGYNIKMTVENNVDNLVIQKEDIVIMLTVNGMYSGGFTNVWQGFKIKNLLTVARKVSLVGAKGIVVSSAHASEFALYPTPKKSDLDALNNLVFCGFHDNINKELQVKGLRYGNSFPVPIQIRWVLDHDRVAGNFKTIMLQFDTQSRKNGEYILAAVCDSFLLAKRSNPSLKLRVICKATAAHSIGGPGYLNRLKSSWSIDHPDLEIILEGRSSKSWAEVIRDVDIFMGLSTEEGLHYFIPELWIAGASIFLTKNGPCNSFENLPEGIFLVDSFEAEGSGTGFYNDNYYSKVRMFDYQKCVLSLSSVLSSDLKVKSRKNIASKYFDLDGSLIKSYLGITDISSFKTFVVEREGTIYQNIIQSSEWPR